MKKLINVMRKGGNELDNYLFKNYKIYAVYREGLVRTDYYLIGDCLWFIEKINGNVTRYGQDHEQYTTLSWLINDDLLTK